MPLPTPIRGRERRGGGVPFSYRPMTLFPPPFILGFLCKAGTVEKRSAGASERDEWLRLVWRFTFGKLDSRRLVFVDETGPILRLLLCTSTHLTVNEPSSRCRETGSRTPPFWRAWVGKGWALRWPSRAPRPRRSLRSTWSISGSCVEAGAGDCHGQPWGARGRKGARVNPKQRMQAALPATLLAGPQPYRGGVLQGQGAATASRSTRS